MSHIEGRDYWSATPNYPDIQLYEDGSIKSDVFKKCQCGGDPVMVDIGEHWRLWCEKCEAKGHVMLINPQPKLREVLPEVARLWDDLITPITPRTILLEDHYKLMEKAQRQAFDLGMSEAFQAAGRRTPRPWKYFRP